MNKHILEKFNLLKARGKKALAVLVDPDKSDADELKDLALRANKAQVDFFFVGGSLVVGNCTDDCIQNLKKHSEIPIVLFPGAPSQVSPFGDALLFLSLISGRNAELLIGQHVISAPMIKQMGIEVIPTGYMVIDGGIPTSVSYMSNANPIPHNKKDIAMCTAIAGEMLGLQTIYMDAGSGALHPITPEMISRVAAAVAAPVIVGGGMRDQETVVANCKAGADIIVIGNAFESHPEKMQEISEAIHALNQP